MLEEIAKMAHTTHLWVGVCRRERRMDQGTDCSYFVSNLVVIPAFTLFVTLIKIKISLGGRK